MNNKVTMVTGSARGIGKAVALSAAKDGRPVVLIDVNQGGLDKTASEIHALGGTAFVGAVDITQKGKLLETLKAAEAQLGPIEALIHCAGVAIATEYADLSEDEWDKVIDINLKGVFLCTQAVIGGMTVRKNGRIVIISSMAGIAGSENAGAHYCASKAGVIGLAKYLSKAFCKYNVTINAVAPGPIETDMVKGLGEDKRQAMLVNMPAGKLGQPDDIANLCIFLCSDQAQFITGAVIEASGGQIVI